jgi:hypothetical protein
MAGDRSVSARTFRSRECSLLEGAGCPDRFVLGGSARLHRPGAAIQAANRRGIPATRHHSRRRALSPDAEAGPGTAPTVPVKRQSQSEAFFGCAELLEVVLERFGQVIVPRRFLARLW